jgi:hypothetical protein
MTPAALLDKYPDIVRLLLDLPMGTAMTVPWSNRAAHRNLDYTLMKLGYRVMMRTTYDITPPCPVRGYPMTTITRLDPAAPIPAYTPAPLPQHALPLHLRHPAEHAAICALVPGARLHLPDWTYPYALGVTRWTLKKLGWRASWHQTEPGVVLTRVAEPAK